jgi:hypothetical protein
MVHEAKRAEEETFLVADERRSLVCVVRSSSVRFELRVMREDCNSGMVVEGLATEHWRLTPRLKSCTSLDTGPRKPIDEFSLEEQALQGLPHSREDLLGFAGLRVLSCATNALPCSVNSQPSRRQGLEFSRRRIHPCCSISSTLEAEMRCGRPSFSMYRLR